MIESAKMVEESVAKTSEEMDVTIRRQRNQIINQQEQLAEYRLAIDSCCQDLEKRWMDIEHLECSIEVLHTIIQELRTKNEDLEVQLEKAGMEKPHSYVEFSDVEEVEEEKEEEKEQEKEEENEQEKEQEKEEEKEQEKEQEPSFVIQTKSWWRRQVKKVGKGMGTFRLRLKSCLGLKTFKTPVARLINIQPVISTTSTINIGMPPVSV